MRRMWSAAIAAVLCLTACNSETGPETMVPACFGEVNFAPREVTSEVEVEVTAQVESPNGFRRLDIIYILDDDESDVRFASLQRTFESETTELLYRGTIPPQKAGCKVTFQVRAITPYDVVSLSERYSYTILDDEEDPVDEPNDNQ